MCGRIYIVGGHLVFGIDTASEEDAGFLAVEERRSEEIFGRTVSVTVAPVAGAATCQGVGHVPHSVVNDAVVAIHIDKEFVACIGISHIGFVGD